MNDIKLRKRDLIAGLFNVGRLTVKRAGFILNAQFIYISFLPLPGSSRLLLDGMVLPFFEGRQIGGISR